MSQTKLAFEGAAGRLPHLIVLGGTGFLGSSIAELACKHFRITSVAAPRFSLPTTDAQGIRTLAAKFPGRTALTQIFQTADAIINAAGVSDAGSTDTHALLAGNVATAIACALSAKDAGVSRYVHVSTAAVQGRRTLDESMMFDPVTPYARSKMIAELELFRLSWPELVVFRPTSVHGVSRTMTRRLVAFANGPLAAVAKPGDDPTPQAFVDNVASAIIYVASQTQSLPPRVLYPWEGVTTGGLITALRGAPGRYLPRSLTRNVVSVLTKASDLSPSLQAHARRVDLLWFGQRQEQGWLEHTGWKPPTSPDIWLPALANSLE